jgi:hypothetical protein
MFYQNNQYLKLQILLLEIFKLTTLISSNVMVSGDFANQAGIQVYYSSTIQEYFYGSYTGSASAITGKLYLLMKDDRASINKTGIWLGVGFGSADKGNSDMVLCFYIPEKEFYCDDYYTNINNIPNPDISLDGKNHISSSFGELKDISINEYKKLLVFTFTKDISNRENYDWAEFPTRQTSKSSHSAAYGPLAGKVPRKHTFRTDNYTLADGFLVLKIL